MKLQIPQNDAATSKSVRKRLSINHLPVELLRIIFEDLDVSDLVGVAELHPYIQIVTECFLRDKLYYKMIVINKNGLGILRDGKLENISSIKMLFQSLKMFGHLMTLLTIDYARLGDKSIMEWNCEEINAQINKFLGDSLTELIVFNYFKNISFNNLVHFPKVEKLVFSRGLMSSYSRNLNEIFPTLRTLKFSRIQDIIPAAINHHFPFLVEVESFLLDNIPNELKDLLRLNPQILKFTIRQCRWEFLEILSHTLPNLQSLDVYYLLGYDSKLEPVQFPKLNSFSLFRSIDFPSELDRGLPLVFGNLRIFKNFDSTYDENLMNVMLQNKNLKFVIFYQPIKNLQSIAQELPYLEQFWTEYLVCTVHSVNDVVRFLETAQNLKLLRLVKCEPEIQGVLFNQIEDEWDMIEQDTPEHIIFVRRESL